MNQLYKNYLFNKRIFVKDYESNPDEAFPSLFSLANLFGIRIVKNKDLASPVMIKQASAGLGYYVPKPFYEGFPNSVRALSPVELLFDQLLNYALTYGMDNFDEPRHSIMEEEFERTAFKENVVIKDFIILPEEDAIEQIRNEVKQLLTSSRPLNEVQYEVVKGVITEYGLKIDTCACKDTAIRLMLDLNDTSYAKLIRLPDFIRVVEYVNYYKYYKFDIKNLNLKNKDRQFLSNVLTVLLENDTKNDRECFEKQQSWCGILHHIHYKPTTSRAEEFVKAIRYSKNGSVYSDFEKAMTDGDVKKATDILLKNKGSAGFLRKLNYILSRSKTDEEIDYVMNKLDTKNNIVIMQMLMQYSNYKVDDGRVFKFSKFNSLLVHYELEKERLARKSVIAPETIDKVVERLYKNLKKNLSNKLGKVYIDDDMKNIALPLQENTSLGGFGTLTKGSRIPIAKNKKIRAFTYWEKVNDIDLSVIGIKDDMTQEEFSWRTMYAKQSTAITYSGDCTSGYEGGSEYYDLDITKLKKLYPDVKYYILCDNVYSQTPFSNCLCKAGYMLRDKKDSGEIFEPKTVETSYIVNCNSTFAYMYAIDVENSELIWLNMAKSSDDIVAGATRLDFLLEYFNSTKVINMQSFFTMLATKVVTDPNDADIVVSDKTLELDETKEQIHSYDVERVMQLMNLKD